MKKNVFLHNAYLLHVLFFCLLTACASTKNFANSNSVYASFQNYSKQFNENNQYKQENLDTIFSSLTSRYQAEILNSRAKTPDLLLQLINDYLAFPLLLKENINHFEKINNDNACLVVNGKTKENEKIAFYLTYKKTSSWLIDYISIEHMANYNEFLTDANCSSKFLDDIRFKEMMVQ